MLVLLLAPAGGALAQTPDDASAVDQYVEDVPTSGGGTIPGKGPPRKTDLPRGIQNEIAKSGGEDADVLTEIATSSVYGAPPTSGGGTDAAGSSSSNGSRTSHGTRAGGGKGERSPGAPAVDPEADVSPSDSLSAAVSAVEDEGAGRLLGLLVVLGLISAAAVAAAVLRQRRRAS